MSFIDNGQRDPESEPFKVANFLGQRDDFLLKIYPEPKLPPFFVLFSLQASLFDRENSTRDRKISLSYSKN